MGSIRTVRQHFGSLFQSMVEDLVERQERRQAEGDGTVEKPTLDHPLIHGATALVEHLFHHGEVPDEPPQEVTAEHGSKIASSLWDCLELAYDFVVARLEGDHVRATKIEDDLRFSACDPGWLEVLYEYIERFGLLGKKGEIPYIRWQNIDDFVLPVVPDDATIALLGDWGTGTADARVNLAEVALHRPAVVIHLGDIYYSGTPRETQRNFLEPMNQILGRPDNPVPIYTLSGNHDMYDAGEGYYQLLPQLNPFAPETAQPASYFSLRSRDGRWQFLAMDTGLHDHDPAQVATGMTYLDVKEVEWHRDKIERFAADGGKTVLLSHHQLFSAFSAIGDGNQKPPAFEAFNTHLWESFGDLIDAGKVTAWFWGHEHNLDIYQPYQGLAFGRCVGHGAIPMAQEEGPYDVRSDLPDPPRLVVDPATGEEVKLSLDPYGTYRHGYVILKLRAGAGEIEARYYEGSRPDQPLYTEVIA